jgi:hypothetical protein
VLVAMPWEQEFNVVEEAMETLQETNGSSHPTISRDDWAGRSNRTQTPSNQLQLELQAERAEREALARQVGRLKDELDHVKGLVATVLESSPNIQQNQTPPSQNQPHPHKTSPHPHKASCPFKPHCGLAKFTVQGCQKRQSCQKEGQGGDGGLGKLTIKAGQCRGGSCSCGGFGEFTIKGGY